MVSIIPESDLGAVHSPRLPRVVPHPCSSAIVFLYSYTGWLLSSVSTDAFGSHSASMKQNFLTLMNGTACLAHHWYRVRRHSSVGSTMGDRLRQRQQCGRSRPRRSCSCRWLRQVPHGPVGPIHPKFLCTNDVHALLELHGDPCVVCLRSSLCLCHNIYHRVRLLASQPPMYDF